MKLAFTLLIVSCLTVSATVVHSQDVKISMNLKDAAISKVIKTIEKNTSYKFVYNNNLFPADNKVNINVTDQTVGEVLNTVLVNTGFSYKLLNKNLIVFTKTEGQAQSVLITGFITDDNEQPLPGVTIRIKGEKATASATDYNGHFNISVASANDVLIITYIGFVTQEVPLGGQKSIRIKLRAATNSLNEVQVIGYGTTTRKLNTGSVSSITAEDIEKQPVANPLNALQGRIAGAIVNQANGLPGSRVTIQIRGQNSLSNGTQPLYIIDGVPFNTQNQSVPATNDLNSFGIFAANQGVSPFSAINPSDIERLDVLKDADATAIYGTRGANGVVLITTKKGKAGKTKLDASVYHGIGKVAKFIDMMNIDQYLQLRKDAFANDGITPTTANAPDLLTWTQTQNTNWQQKYLGGTANTTDAQTTISGGDIRTRFLFNVGYHDDGTVFPGDFGDARFSSRFSSQHNSLDNKFNVSFTASYSADKTNLLGTDLNSAVYNLPPNMPLYNGDGTLFWNANFTNPESYLLAKYTGKTNNLLSNVQLRYTILPGLDLKTTLGFDKITIDQNQQNPALSKNPSSSPTNSARFANIDQETYIMEPQATYTHAIAKGKLSLLAGTTFQQSLNKGTSITADNYSNPALLGALTGAGSLTSFSTSYTLYKYNSVFGRANYDWMDKYILNVNFRRDGSSRFGADHRFGNFGSLGAAWIFSNEKFIKSIPGISYGKLKASYGLTGNDQIQDYQYLTLFSASSGILAYQGSSVLSPTRINNPELHWETNKKLEFGLELGFFNDRILLTSDYYQNRTSDQLGSLTLGTQSGFNSYQANFNALIQNSGFEFELNTTNISKKEFEWKTSFNLTIPTTKLLDADPSYFSYNQALLGKPLSVVMRYNYLGVDPQTGLPLYQNQSTGGTSTFTPSFSTDRVPIGYTAPQFYGGLSNSFRYKNFDLSFFFQLSKQMGNILTSSTPGTFTNQNTNWLARWNKAGDITSLPKATTNSSIYSSYGSSDAIWGDASYARLRNLYLSYTFPTRILSKVKVAQLRIFFQGQNLYTWTKNKYVSDPETIATTNQSSVVTPPLRVITTGLNVSF